MNKNRGFIGEIFIFLTAIFLVGGFLYTQTDPDWKTKIKDLFDGNKLEFAEQIPPVPPELLPDVDVGPDMSIKFPTNSVTLSGKAKSKDGSPLTYNWFKLTGGIGTIVSPFSNKTVVKGLKNGKYLFRLIVTDESGYKSADEVFVTVTGGPSSNSKIAKGSSKSSQSTSQSQNYSPDNIPPFASAGPDKYLTLPQNYAVLSGSGSDSDGQVVSYLWNKVSGGNVKISNPNSATITVSDLVEGSYVFSLTVIDNKGATSIANVSVIVGNTPPSNTNKPPKANAGPDKSITLSSPSVTLSGSGTDSDGTIVAYYWTKISGDGGTIENPSSASTNVSDFSQGVYTFELKVTDNQGATDTDTVTINVDDEAVNNPPNANAGPDQSITLPTDTVTLSGSGTDSDGSIVSYYWSKLSGSGGTITDPNSSSTTVTGLSAGTYSFRLIVEDNSGDNDADIVVVTVNQAIVNEPPVALAGPDQSITLPTNSVTLSGSGSDDGAIASYEWSKISGDGGTITNPSQSNTTVTDLLSGTYVFRLTVTDDGGLSASDEITITVQ
jgi:hypothetical protein